MPEVNTNVELIKGWFDKTLPDFLEKHHEKCAFIHIDCDLYSSVKQVFDQLGNRITCGTVIEFDDFFEHPNWKNGESKAFFEYVEKNNLKYEYLEYSNVGGQCAIKIVEHDSV